MNIFITGSPGCGKSTLTARVLDKLSGKRISGIITPEIRYRGIRTGFRIIDLASGKEEVMASVNIDRGPAVSRYRVNVKAINAILDAFLESYGNSDIIVIDEIGKMEFQAPRFKGVLEMILDSDRTVLATLSKHLVPEYRSRGTVHFLSRDGFDEVYSAVSRQLGIAAVTEKSDG